MLIAGGHDRSKDESGHKRREKPMRHTTSSVSSLECFVRSFIRSFVATLFTNCKSVGEVSFTNAVGIVFTLKMRSKLCVACECNGHKLAHGTKT